MMRLARVAVVLCDVSGASTALFAQEAQRPVLLVLDQSAVDYGEQPHVIPPEAANAPIAGVGLRETPTFFSARTGESVTLPGGADGTDGWFAIRSAPLSWESSDGSNDGLENFFAAGAGLGSPDEAGERATLLANVSGVVALRAGGLNLLAGRYVCAVLYDGNVTIPEDPAVGSNLSGANLGVAAFQVTSVDTSGTDWPSVTVQILDVHETCGGTIVSFSEAP